VRETDGQSIESPTGSAKAGASNGNPWQRATKLRSIAHVFEDFALDEIGNIQTP